ncbi:hypothetical protein NUH88_05050 [Nisaea acidiphila]|uniref:Uncharacterized protein n=1 Tax=Nisaea acidiphila TaxID=1862145 RepID=A0A9J7AXS8_9PROT|nr:hypothetical protein [Nisaea acidiphila]UUX51060.1 hypothetical protein NUH88_05050 [Nisaea acidiphila]
MTSKGVDYYFVNTSSYALNAEAKNTDGSYALSPISVTSSPLITTGNCQVSLEFPYLDPYGSFQFSTTTTPSKAVNESINTVTGNTSGPLADMMDTPSLIGSDFALSYGMFDAGTGSGTGLTNQDQIYAYLTPSQKNWMGNLAASNASVNAAPLASFVLPGAHDAGTFDLTQVNKLCGSAAGVAALAAAILSWIPGATIILGLAAAQLKGVVVGEAVTQKDNTTTMLDLGCRYFDFRPGYAPSAVRSISPGVYHIHNVVPGATYQGFMQDVLTWLVANPTEIVAVSLGTAGFNDHSTMDPSTETLQSQFIAAQQAAGATSIQIGAASDLQTAYKDLIAANKRLFFLNQPSLNWYPAEKYDSYNDDDYATTDPATIIRALNGMTKSGQAGHDYTVLQFQATATNQNVVNNVLALADSLSNAYEPLMSTKADMDSNTYPWALTNVPNLGDDQLVVLLNDFVDNALAGSVASALTLERCTS